MSLTEFERNLLIGGGVIAGAGLTAAVAYALMRGSEPQPQPKHSISIEATEGGTTYPSGYIEYGGDPVSLTVSAIASEGCVFLGWYLNGEFAGTDPAITVLVEGQNLLIASFEEEDVPPLFPAYVRPIQNCEATEWWRTTKTSKYDPLGFLFEDTIHIGTYLYEDGFIKFKICDAAGNGVPGQDIVLYTDVMPDVTDFGHLLLNNGEHFPNHPLILKSDGDGVVSAKARYWWIEPYSNFKQTLGRGGSVHYSSWYTQGDITPIFEGLESLDYTAFTSFTRLLNPLYRTLNPVHAYWVSNPSLPVQGDAIVDCLVKFVPSHDYP